MQIDNIGEKTSPLRPNIHFEITQGIEGLDSDMFFKYKTANRTRGYSWMLAKFTQCNQISINM